MDKRWPFPDSINIEIDVDIESQLNFCLSFAKKLRKRPHYWKQMIVLIYMLIHSAQISCFKSSSLDKFSERDKECILKMYEIYDRSEEDFASEIASGSKLAQRFSNPFLLQFEVLFKTIGIDCEGVLLARVEKINSLRNKLAHYDGNSHVIFIEYLQSVALGALDVLIAVMKISFRDPSWDWGYGLDEVDERSKRRKRAIFRKVEALKRLLA